MRQIVAVWNRHVPCQPRPVMCIRSHKRGNRPKSSAGQIAHRTFHLATGSSPNPNAAAPDNCCQSRATVTRLHLALESVLSSPSPHSQDTYKRDATPCSPLISVCDIQTLLSRPLASLILHYTNPPDKLEAQQAYTYSLTMSLCVNRLSEERYAPFLSSE